MRKFHKDESKPLWRRTASGALVLRKPNRRIETGDEVYATEEELGKHVDEFELIKEAPKKGRGRGKKK